MIYKWSRLNWVQESILDKVRIGWNKLLEDSSKNEKDYHSYISEHAGFFFYKSTTPHFLILSQPHLGSDYVPDFVYFVDLKSQGTCVHIIELESPHDLIYTRSNIPSSHLMSAVQQVQNWKEWLRNNPVEANKYSL